MNHVREILKRLERNTAAGAYLSQVFTDWLDITHATLSAIPRHVESVTTTGQLAEDTSPGQLNGRDTPEAATMFARFRARYPQAWAWQTFSEAFHILLESTEGFWNTMSRRQTPTAGTWSAPSIWRRLTRSTLASSSRLGTSPNSWRA